MGARVIKLICANPACAKPFKAERKQGPKACCSYKCDRWLRHAERRKEVVANFRYMPQWVRHQAGAWLTS